MIGDISSNERGTGARFNDGKPPVGLLPLSVMADAIERTADVPAYVVEAVRHVGLFQFREDASNLYEALAFLCAATKLSIADLMCETARVLEHGRKKYAAWNWLKGMPWSVCFDCIGRHALKMIDNAMAIDEESGYLHAAHIACNIIFLLTYIDHYPEGDDRPAP